VHYSDLEVIKKVHEKVKIVRYQGEKYVYKYSYLAKHKNAFYRELRNYIKLSGMPGIPSFKAVVLNPLVPPDYPGLLISYIEGRDLQKLNDYGQRDSRLLDVTERVIRLAADLEDRGFYHQDIKCNNILRRRHDKEIFFIDFEQDVREGMYPAEWDKWIRRNRIVSPANALFALGKTIWELWVGSIPKRWSDIQWEMEDLRNGFVARIYYSCLFEEVGSIRALHDKYYGGNEEREGRMSFASEEHEAKYRWATKYRRRLGTLDF
jgi:serine/threonine protein kinase